MVNKVQKKLKKFVEEQGDWMRRASFKNWIFIGVLFVLGLIIVLSRNTSVLAIAVSIGLVHFLVTKNLTSAMMSGAIVGILVLLYIRYKTDEMYKNRENADEEGVSGEVENDIDETVVTDEEEPEKDGPQKLIVKGEPNGELYVELPKHDHKEDAEEEDKEEMDKEDEDAKDEEATETKTAGTDSFTGKRVVVGADTCCSTPAPVK